MRGQTQSHSLTAEEIQRLAEGVYIYGYPLLLMDVIKRSYTATPHSTFHNTPLNQFAHGRFLPGSLDQCTFHPNIDCLNSSAWLDLSREPVVLRVPRSHRYHLLAFVSSWYEIFGTASPRNVGTTGWHVGFVSPRWVGRLPVGVTPIVAPTETAWITGWFEMDGAEDSGFVHRAQDQFQLSGLSEWATPHAKHSVPFRLDMDQTNTPQEQVAGLDAKSFYTQLSRLMERSPAQPCDAEVVSQFARIGFAPGPNFVFDMLPPETIRAMKFAVNAAQVKMTEAEKKAGGRTTVNNWSLRAHPGRYERNYLDRAVAARTGIAPAPPEDILCFQTTVDDAGEPLKGSHRYVINFCRDSIPPVNAFWSITLYESRRHQAPNIIRHNLIGNRDRLRLNADNTLSIYIQHAWPGMTRDCNWLPAPKETFNLTLRMYWPKPGAFTGMWHPPAVMRTN